MAGENGNATGAGEGTPLLGEHRRSGSDDGSEETLTDRRVRVDEESVDEDDDKANQQVGRVRGLLIILSLWGLIFLQGTLSSCKENYYLIANEGTQLGICPASQPLNPKSPRIWTPSPMQAGSLQHILSQCHPCRRLQLDWLRSSLLETVSWLLLSCSRLVEL